MSLFIVVSDIKTCAEAQIELPTIHENVQINLNTQPIV